MHDDTLASIGRGAALAAAPLALVSIAIVIAAESSGSMDSMAAPLPVAGGILGLAATCALLLGLVGLHLSTRHRMDGRGGGAMALTLLGAGLTVGAAWSTAVVAPALDAAFPGMLTEPLAPLVAGYVVSHAVLGVGVLVWAVIARRTGAVSKAAGAVLIVGGILCLTPLPTRYLLVAIGTAMAVRAASRSEASVAMART